MSGRPIRVAQVVGRMMGGGVEATVMNHYRHIDRSRVQFDFIAQTDSTVVPREEIESLGGRVFFVPPYKNPIAYVNACRRLFKDIKPDIVHSNMNAVSMFTLMAAKQAGVKIRIAHSHSTSNPAERGKTLVKNMLRPFSRVYPTHYAACSDYAARWLFGDKLVDSGAVHLIRNAIDLDQFSYSQQARSQKRSELGIQPDQLVVGQVGRLCFQKNQSFSLKVFAELLKRVPDAVLIIVGDGDSRGELEYQTRSLGITNRVRFLGVRADVAELYSLFDVLLFPSTYEGLGMAAIEAQATGLSVIASDHVPNEAGVIPRLMQRLSLDEPPAYWADQIIRVSKRHLKRTGQEIELANVGYDINASAQQLTEWYEKICPVEAPYEMTVVR